MQKLIFVYFGFLLAVIILCLLTLIIHRRRTRKAIKAIQQQTQQEPIKQPEQVSTQKTQQAPQRVTPPVTPPFAAAPSQSLDEAIQSGMEFLKDGAYEQAVKSFQEGLRLTNDSQISMQLYLELARIHNLLNDHEAALKDLDLALEFCRKSKNGATEQQILRIKELISSQRSTET
jgi:tetratricopeptide (TPR) repeat protein